MRTGSTQIASAVHSIARRDRCSASIILNAVRINQYRQARQRICQNQRATPHGIHDSGTNTSAENGG